MTARQFLDRLEAVRNEVVQIKDDFEVSVLREHDDFGIRSGLRELVEVVDLLHDRSVVLAFATGELVWATDEAIEQ